MSAAYCTRAEVSTKGINPEALVDVEPSTLDGAIAWASDKIDGYLDRQFKLPLLSWGEDVRGCCARLAAIRSLRVRGVGPEDATSLDQMESREMSWLRDVAKGVAGARVVDSSPSAEVGVPSSQPRIVSASSRGFSRITPPPGAFGGCGGGGSFGT